MDRTIIIKEMHLRNFKGVSQRDISFTDRTEIAGQNASGKTTIVDAFMWLIFDKDSTGATKFSVRPLDKDGKPIHQIEIQVEAIVNVDGKDISLMKIQKEKWTKKRGEEKQEFSGNVNEYLMNGYPQSEKEYKAYISENICDNEDTFKMLTNPQTFINTEWKKQRQMLMSLVTEIKDDDILKSYPECEPLRTDIEMAKSVDDIKAKYQRTYKELKKDTDELPIRIDELSKQVINGNSDRLRADLTTCEKNIEELTAKDVKGDLRALQSRLRTAEADRSDRYTELASEKKSAYTKLKNDVETVDMDLNRLDRQKKALLEKCDEIADKQNTADDRIEKLKQKIADYKAMAITESDKKCFYCGQTLPESDIAEKIKEIESKKAKGISDCETEIAELDGLIKSGDAEIMKHQETITKIDEEAERQTDEARKLHTAYESFDMDIDTDDDERYTELTAEIEKIKAQIKSIEETDTTEIEKAIAEARNKAEEIKREIVAVEKSAEIERQIASYRDELKDTAQKMANAEKMLYLLETFTRAKMELVEKAINGKFKTVKFSLFETQINGGIREICTATVDGVRISDLNSGHKIVAGLDIINTLSEVYGIKAPVFVDNSETINDYNIPEIDTQLITLKVTEDKELIVKGG